MNRVYVCPWCGVVFGRLHAPDRVSGDTWYPLRRACEDCPPWPSWETGEVPGSEIDWYDGWTSPVAHDPFLGLDRSGLLREVGLLDRWLTRGRGTWDNADQTKQESLTMQNLANRIAELQAKALTGTVTDADLREALRLMREDRVSAVRSRGAAATKRANSPPADAEKLAKEFGV